MVLIGDPSSSDSAMFSAAVSASNSEKCWKTMPMPSFLRDARAGDPDRLALPEDLAGIRLQRAEQHLDQRRLAGAVLAEQCMDFALGDVEIDMVARRQRAEYLGQATNLEQVRAIVICTHSASHLVCQICSVFPQAWYALRCSRRKAAHDLKELQEFQRNRPKIEIQARCVQIASASKCTHVALNVKQGKVQGTGWLSRSSCGLRGRNAPCLRP